MYMYLYVALHKAPRKHTMVAKVNTLVGECSKCNLVEKDYMIMVILFLPLIDVLSLVDVQ